MVHDTSHYVFERLHPTFKTHSAAHAALEKAMIDYVIEKGLHVEIAPAPKPIVDLRAVKLAVVDASIKRWTTKAKRAATALRKLQARRRRLTKTSG